MRHYGRDQGLECGAACSDMPSFRDVYDRSGCRAADGCIVKSSDVSGLVSKAHSLLAAKAPGRDPVEGKRKEIVREKRVPQARCPKTRMRRVNR